jgi:2-O-(6-phospho-alpha-D-mannosyl)-D-glycerate hydrolase
MDQLYLVAHTHWDREWYQPFQQMRTRLLTMTDRLLDLLERRRIPCFHFDGQTIVLEDYLEVRPERERRIAKLVKAGVLNVGPWYLLADSFLPSGEALIRNLEIGARLARRFGKSAHAGYLPDQFGHAAQLPQIVAGFGLSAAVVYRGVPREVRRNRFVWEALDGTGVLAIYLPFGYANGASLPSDCAASLRARVLEIAERERGYAAGTPILVMNGNDHAEPDPRVYELLGDAAHDGVALESGTLDDYIGRLTEFPRDGVEHYRGELRSPARATITPGVTSIRAWIKQRDFHNCYLLEKIAEPMLAVAAAGERNCSFGELAELAWRTEIQNHPHDSICGCSVDQVHRDMRYRFDQAQMMTEDVIRGAAAAIFEDHSGGESAVAVFNPTFARQAIVTCEADLDSPDASYVAVDPSGRRMPAAVEISRRERALDVELPAADLKGLIPADANPRILDQYVTGFDLRPAEGGKFQLDLSTSRSPQNGVDIAEVRRRLAEIPDTAWVLIHATSAQRARVMFVASEIGQAGFTLYRLVRDEAAQPVSAAATGDSIENEFYRVAGSRRGLLIDHLRSGKRLELYFEDDGDRGDEYNFDPVAGAPAVAEPASSQSRVIERGPVRSRLGATLIYLVPAALSRDRRSRGEEAAEVLVELTATLYAGTERVDFEVSIDNRARDHRFRAALATPIDAAESVSDTNFGVLRRALEPPEPAGDIEDVYPTAPHRSFTGVESPELSAAIIARGIYEAEVRRDTHGATILLTLLRCVGWLSRGDLAMRRGDAGPAFETPDAQEQGTHRFEFAVATWRGNYSQSDLVQRGQTYAFAPRAFPARTGAELGSARLCECDNPRLVFSTARPLARGGGYLVRIYSASASEEKARLTFNGGRARAVDLAGRPSRDPRLTRRRDGSIAIKLRPFQIATFQVRPPASRLPGGSATRP